MSYNPSTRRKALRKGRERGCSVYIPAEVLEHAGFANGDVPFYKTWASRKSRGAVYIQLYEKGDES